MSSAPPWTFERPRGCLPLVGGLVLASSVLGIGAALLGFAGGDPAWLVGMLVACVAVLPAGAWLAFGRQGVVVDRAHNTVLEYSAALVPLRERHVALSDFRTVSILREKVRGVANLSFLYHVRLVGDGVFVELVAPGDYEYARSVAAPLSAYTGLPLQDGQVGGA